MANINEFLLSHAKDLAGIRVLSPGNTMQLVDLLFNNNQKVLGIDGIYVTVEGNRPSIDDSISLCEMYDTKSSKTNIQSNIRHFLESRLNKKELFFEVIFSE